MSLLAKVANTLGIQWHCVIDDDSGRRKYESSVKNNLGSSTEQARISFPYPKAEIHLLCNGYDGLYASFMPAQNLSKITKSPGDAGYWEEYASHLPNRAKTRVAAAVAAEMEQRGATGVTQELRTVLNKVVALAGDA